MNYKILFFLCLITTSIKPENLEKVDLSKKEQLKTWLKEPKHLALLTTCILGPVITTYGYFFGYDQIKELIYNIAYKGTQASTEIAKSTAHGVIEAGVDSLVSDPKLIAEIAALGLMYKTIFVGIPFFLTNLMNVILKVKQ